MLTASSTSLPASLIRFLQRVRLAQSMDYSVCKQVGPVVDATLIADPRYTQKSLLSATDARRKVVRLARQTTQLFDMQPTYNQRVSEPALLHRWR